MLKPKDYKFPLRQCNWLLVCLEMAQYIGFTLEDRCEKTDLLPTAIKVGKTIVIWSVYLVFKGKETSIECGRYLHKICPVMLQKLAYSYFIPH